MHTVITLNFSYSSIIKESPEKKPQLSPKIRENFLMTKKPLQIQQTINFKNDFQSGNKTTIKQRFNIKHDDQYLRYCYSFSTGSNFNKCTKDRLIQRFLFLITEASTAESIKYTRAKIP